MDPRALAPVEADPEAVEFVRFCRARRRVGWPELYDEMWAVASRSLFRGYSLGELEERGIGFSLYGTPHLAAMAAAHLRRLLTNDDTQAIAARAFGFSVVQPR